MYHIFINIKKIYFLTKSIIITKMITFYFYFSNINSCFFLVCFQFIFSPSSLCIFFLFYSIYFFSFNSCFVFSLQKPTWANMSFLGCGLIYVTLCPLIVIWQYYEMTRISNVSFSHPFSIETLYPKKTPS